MTLSLVAVFIPVLFMGGVVGRMFNEFGLVISLRHPDLRHRVADPDADAVLALLKPIDHHEKHNVPAALLRVELQQGHERLRLVAAHASWPAAPWCWRSRSAPSVLTGMLFQAHSQGLLPDRGYRPDLSLDGGAGRRVVRRHGGATGRDLAEIITRGSRCPAGHARRSAAAMPPTPSNSGPSSSSPCATSPSARTAFFR